MNAQPIVICSYYYGGNAEGNCTARLARALAAQGVEMEVVTSPLCCKSEQDQQVKFHEVCDCAPQARLLLNELSRRLGLLLLPESLWARNVGRYQLKTKAALVYGRACPAFSLMAAHRLASKHGLPYAFHLSDPLPGTWPSQQNRPGKRLARLVAELTPGARFVTFTTAQAMAYQKNIWRIPSQPPCFVLPHIAPPFQQFGAPALSKPRIFLYTGLFYLERGPDSILAAFAAYCRKYGDATLHFVGSRCKQLEERLAEFEYPDKVIVHDYTNDLQEFYRHADLLIASDSFVGEPVFLTTKLVEYAATDRPVLLITPAQSPGSQLLGKIPRTSIAAGDAPEQAAVAMRELITRPLVASDYQERKRALKPHDADHVAQSFRCRCEEARVPLQK